MSIEVTAKGYHQLRVNGAPFSTHVQEREGIEKAAKALAADPTLACTIVPPTIEVRSSSGTVIVTPNPEPVLSDGGEDLIDFLERISPAADPVPVAGGLYDTMDAFLDASKRPGYWLISRRYVDELQPDGTFKRRVAAYAWRGFGVLVHRRAKGTIKIAVD